jgi:serine/threonine-protein kinase HipA
MRSHRAVTVCLRERLTAVGSLRFTADPSRQRSMFTCLKTWLHDPRAFALSPDLPLGMSPAYAGSRGRDDTRAGLPAAFQDTAPDAWGRLLLERVHGAGLTEFERLTLADDTTRQGALRFVDETGTVLSSTGRPIPNVVGGLSL